MAKIMILQISIESDGIIGNRDGIIMIKTVIVIVKESERVAAILVVIVITTMRRRVIIIKKNHVKVALTKAYSP